MRESNPRSCCVKAVSYHWNERAVLVASEGIEPSSRANQARALPLDELAVCGEWSRDRTDLSWVAARCPRPEDYPLVLVPGAGFEPAGDAAFEAAACTGSATRANWWETEESNLVPI